MTISDSSVRGWLERLEAGDDLAAVRLWNAYFDRLVHLAHWRLQAKYQKVSDAEDIALSAFHSFCRGVENKKFPSLSDSHGLWRLLVSITIRRNRKSFLSGSLVERVSIVSQVPGQIAN